MNPFVHTPGDTSPWLDPLYNHIPDLQELCTVGRAAIPAQTKAGAR